MEGKVRASKTPSKSNSGRDTSSRNSSPPSPIQTTSGAPNTPKIKSKRGSKHVSNQDRTRSRRGRLGTRGSTAQKNFVLRNRQACKKPESTGVPRTAGHPTSKGSSPPRIKACIFPLIGDEIGTSSNKGSSFFMNAGHDGVREPKRTANKQRSSQDHNSNS
ncbi:uncharacterized protein [Physcomitrium patens]|uniref:uncharacterized protein isoform X1 n=1 Tax=Physcomitrium patens TaxID=3218 RepID=UPI003CCDC18E